MSEIISPVKVEIDLQQFADNLKEIKKYIGKRKFCLPLKADAYGHGLIEIAKVAESENIDYFAIARIEEGIKLRRHNFISTPILLLGPFFNDQIPYLYQFNIEPTISSIDQLSCLLKYLQKNKRKAFVHLKIDTGMNRIGASLDEAAKIYNKIEENKKFISIKSIYSHFASSDEPKNIINEKQLRLFDSFFLKTKAVSFIKHFANSGGIINFPQSMYDMVRPGLLSYGYMPYTKKKKDLLPKVKPILSLKSKVGLVKSIKKGEGVSYNHKYIAKKDGNIAIIPIGYGDGYKYNLSNKSNVIIKNKKYQVVGKICMDLLAVDIGLDSISIEDDVILLGSSENNHIWADEIASNINTHIYEILCSFTQRVPLYYF